MSNNFEPFERMIKHRKATYTKKNGLLEITCANGHVFQKTKHQIHNGEWCGKCFKNIYILMKRNAGLFLNSLQVNLLSKHVASYGTI